MLLLLLLVSIQSNAMFDPNMRLKVDDLISQTLSLDEGDEPAVAKPEAKVEPPKVLLAPPKKTRRVVPQAELAESAPKIMRPDPTPQLNWNKPRNVDLSQAPLIFDIPVTYNSRVRFWIHHFQSSGRGYFRKWLERSSRFLPFLQHEMVKAGLPQDLAYIAMVESGFSFHAASHQGAMGMWQFIVPTGLRYGLRANSWIDERKDFVKATSAAIRYMRDLYSQFGSWYLVAASYNMGENGVRRLIARHRTQDFWELADRGVLPQETTNYVPKIIAAMLISKAPALYGFRDLDYQMPMSFEYFEVPGGTDISTLARHLKVSEKYMLDLNPELLKGAVPRDIVAHRIRIPKGSLLTVAQYVRTRLQTMVE